jgi:hypothetical protein
VKMRTHNPVEAQDCKSLAHDSATEPYFPSKAYAFASG